MNDLLEPRYKAQVMPELYPHYRQPVLWNWPEDELVSYCGGNYLKFDMYRSFMKEEQSG